MSATASKTKKTLRVPGKLHTVLIGQLVTMIYSIFANEDWNTADVRTAAQRLNDIADLHDKCAREQRSPTQAEFKKLGIDSSKVVPGYDPLQGEAVGSMDDALTAAFGDEPES